MKILSAPMHSSYICFLRLKGRLYVLILHSLGPLMNFLGILLNFQTKT